jgi:hypothetical protein
MFNPFGFRSVIAPVCPIRSTREKSSGGELTVTDRDFVDDIAAEFGELGFQFGFQLAVNYALGFLLAVFTAVESPA